MSQLGFPLCKMSLFWRLWEGVVADKPLASAGGCLYYVGPKKEEKREVIVDPERRRQVFLESHFTEIGNHLGQKKTVHRIQSRYYWLGIVKDVVDWVSGGQ